MKNRIKIIFSIGFVLLMAAIFTACGASAPDTVDSATEIVQSSQRKIIYSVNFSITSKDFKDVTSFIEGSLEDDEWFDLTEFSSSSAYFVARVKTARLDAYVNGISDYVGEDNVSGYRKSAKDVSIDYYEKQGQIDSLEMERTRLQELMETKATSIGELIQINQRLSQVEYELQRLRGEIYQFDSQVDYSMVTITVSEYSYGWIAPLIILGLAVSAGIVLMVLYSKKAKKHQPNTVQNQGYNNDYNQGYTNQPYTHAYTQPNINQAYTQPNTNPAYTQGNNNQEPQEAKESD